MNEHAPIDHHELQERVDRLFDESDRVVVQILGKYVDAIRQQEEDSSL
ncbi:hypothetical protein ABIB48_002617 [Arthrobacter sp. UYCu511]